jgi:hypothetical protein
MSEKYNNNAKYYICTENLFDQNNKLAFKKNGIYKLIKDSLYFEKCFVGEDGEEQYVYLWDKYFLEYNIREEKLKRILECQKMN